MQDQVVNVRKANRTHTQIIEEKNEQRLKTIGLRRVNLADIWVIGPHPQKNRQDAEDFCKEFTWKKSNNNWWQ